MRKKSPSPIPPVFQIAPVSFALYGGVALIFLLPSFFTGSFYFGDDLLYTFAPLCLYFQQALGQGHWPLWCPLILGGEPFWADPNVMGLYPLTALRLFLPLYWGTAVFCAVHLLIAGWGAHLWLRSLGVSERAARLGALVFSLSGFFWWEIIHPPILAAFAWVPWLAWTLEKFARGFERSWAFAVGLAFAMVFLCGSFQITLGVFYAGGFYFLGRVIAQGTDIRVLAGGRWAVLGLILVWASFPIWAFWIPVSEFFNLSTRVQQPFDFEGFNADLCLNWFSPLQFLFPARAFDSAGNLASYSTLTGNEGCLGIFAFWLIVTAFRRQARSAIFWAAGVGLTALLVGLGKSVPLFKWLCEFAPGFTLIRSPFRFLFLWVAAGAFLAAVGWDFLESGSKSARTRKIWKAGYWFFLGILGLSLFWNGWNLCPSARGPGSNFEFLKNCPELEEVKRLTGLGRVFIGDNIAYPVLSNGRPATFSLPTNVVYALGLRHIQGCSPVSLWEKVQLDEMPFETLARLMALNLIANGTKKAFVPPGFTESKAGPMYLYCAKKSFPFVYAPARFETVGSDADRLVLMGDKNFNPYRLSYFSEQPPAERLIAASPGPDKLNYQLTRDDPDNEVFQVSRQKGGWTVFSEVMYPGWKAWVDGSPAPLLTANHIFRSVFVPAGSHEVRFSYEPWWWTPIRIGLLLWLLSVLGLFWKPWRRWALGEL